MIIGLTGGMVSGKRSLTEFLIKQGFIALTYSDVLDQELKEKGIPITRKNQQDLGNEIRNREGPGALSKRLILRMEGCNDYVLDGIRNPGEVLELRKCKDFFLVAIDSSQKNRFQRLINRNMERDPKTWEDFVKADSRDFDDGTENGLQIAKCMKMADFTISNNGSFEEFIEKFEKVLEMIKSEYLGVIIEESLADKKILNNKNIKIVSTNVENVTEKHKTPWIKQWTLHYVSIKAKKAKKIAIIIAKSLDKEHNWYADFKNNKTHYIIFRDKVFIVDVHNQEEYDSAKEYGISLGIPSYQVNFKAVKYNKT